MRRESKNNTITVGIDTETYEDPEHGIHSIQVYGDHIENYISHMPMLMFSVKSSDDLMVDKFISQMIGLDAPVKAYFYNLTFDFSQMEHRLIELYEPIYEHFTVDKDGKSQAIRLKTGQIRITQSDTKVYKVEIQLTPKHKLSFFDIQNVIPGSLNGACKQFLGEESQKDVIESKRFSRGEYSDIIRHYAMQDAKLTYQLALQLIDMGILVYTGGKYPKDILTCAGLAWTVFSQMVRDHGASTVHEYYEVDKYDMEKIERICRPSYRGGMAQVLGTPREEPVFHIDKHSMYPSQMKRDDVPYGPLYDEPPEGPYTYLIAPTGRITLKEGESPYLMWDSSAKTCHYALDGTTEGGKYVRDAYISQIGDSQVFWEFEWDYICKTHDVKLAGSKKYYVKIRRDKVMYDYVMKFYKMKRESKGAKKAYAKLMLNSLYGKFGQREEGVTIIYDKVNDKRIKEKSEMGIKNVMIGSWITAQARIDLMSSVRLIPFENRLYTDTDSIFYHGDTPDEIPITDDELATWGIEDDSGGNMILIGPKSYQMMKEGKIITRCAGLRTDIAIKLGWGELIDGRIFQVQKTRRNTRWQKYFYDTEFKVSNRIPRIRK